MQPEEASTADELAGNPFAAGDVVNILRERGWLVGEPSPGHLAWCEHSAAILGGHVADRNGLEYLLSLIFHYDAREIQERVDAHVVLSRFAARDVVRHLALLVLESGPLASERFNEIIGVLKEKIDVRGRELFHPIRLALTGRAGEGEVDRVILLLDEAAALSFAVRVKSTRERILEFCAALD